MTNDLKTLCPHAMQVHRIYQETNDVYTLELLCRESYSYQPGQYALVNINDQGLVRAYTLSSSPGLSQYITLTVRHIENGVGSSWLTQNVNIGDTLWLSDAQGEFTCVITNDNQYLMLAAGCGVTPIISMTRWLLANRPQAHITVCYHVKTSDDTIFAEEWHRLTERYPSTLSLHIITTRQTQNNGLSGRLSQSQLQNLISNFSDYTVMTCGPEDYMTSAERICRSLAVKPERFYQERFHGLNACDETDKPRVNITVIGSAKQFTAPVGTTLLYALEQHNIPIIAACRAGVCGSCKTRVVSGSYTTDSNLALSEDEIKRGYVLACSCHIEGDLVID
jgi:NADH oxidoreductase Hcr